MSMSSPLPGAWRTVTPSTTPAWTPSRALPSKTTTTGSVSVPDLTAVRTCSTNARAAPDRSRHQPVGREPTTFAASMRSTTPVLCILLVAGSVRRGPFVDGEPGSEVWVLFCQKASPCPPVNTKSGSMITPGTGPRSDLSPEQLEALLPILARHTSSTSGWFLLWDGFGDLNRRVFDHRVPELHHPMRDFYLFRGPIASYGEFSHGPNYWWPDDRAWCVCTDTDFVWSYIAASAACIEDVLSVRVMDAMETKPENPAHAGMDVINFPDQSGTLVSVSRVVDGHAGGVDSDGELRIRDQALGAGEACRRILRALPTWFGIPTSVDDYVATAERPVTVVATLGGEVVGILPLVRPSPYAAEVYVMAVLPELHRQGIGRALLGRAESMLVVDGVEFLQVKTLAPSKPDEGYEKTRAFYLAHGFRPREEFPDLWDAENPALQMIKVIANVGGAP
jgi:GNAT superfamily N-acetyltransferase